MASPPAARTTSSAYATGSGRIWRSSPPVTTCCRRISSSSAFPN
jgi:hypothetical protein